VQNRKSPKYVFKHGVIHDLVGFSCVRAFLIRLNPNDFTSRNLAGAKFSLDSPGQRIHCTAIHGFPKIHGYQHGYPCFLHVSLKLSTQVWISTLISKQGYPYKGILEWISINYKMNGYPCFMDMSLIILGFMDIHLDIHGCV